MAPRPPNTNHTEALRLYRLGYQLVAIAHRFKVSAKTIGKWKVRYQWDRQTVEQEAEPGYSFSGTEQFKKDTGGCEKAPRVTFSEQTDNIKDLSQYSPQFSESLKSPSEKRSLQSSAHQVAETLGAETDSPFPKNSKSEIPESLKADSQIDKDLRSSPALQYSLAEAALSPTETEYADYMNPLAMADKYSAGMDFQVGRAAELAQQSYCVMVEVIAGTGIKYQEVPVRPEQIDWDNNKVKLMDQEYSLDFLVPDRKYIAEGLKQLIHITGSAAQTQRTMQKQGVEIGKLDGTHEPRTNITMSRPQRKTLSQYTEVHPERV
jgi:hypothetical protein